ncbi:hypothetical protein EJ08DRAFT_379350 [Tothia fuscella]|uniref:F-box domain-containing protein n=1 Tax=Tothia fuscella TaxID=1048955 RepID=A0A9P4NLN3_9PEZI|nr:hypothetical protein EJ08DRAFT_379350 [Tothia fuscella]
MEPVGSFSKKRQYHDDDIADSVARKVLKYNEVTTQSNKGTSPKGFFKLPREIRDLVYDELFRSEVSEITKPTELNTIMNVTRVNKQFRVETESLFYNNYYQGLSIVFSTLPCLQSFLRSIGSDHRHPHRKLTLRLFCDQLYPPHSEEYKIFDKCRSSCISRVVRGMMTNGESWYENEAHAKTPFDGLVQTRTGSESCVGMTCFLGTDCKSCRYTYYIFCQSQWLMAGLCAEGDLSGLAADCGYG